jgi:CheY-like chemotaxis protein
MLTANETNRRILLIEDSPDDAEFLQLAFSERAIDCTLDLVSDGDAAIEYLQAHAKPDDAHHPDLILLDLNLPCCDGHEVLAMIKHHAELRLIPVLVLTTSESPTDVRRAYAGHANAYISKPRDFSGVRELVSGIENFWLKSVTLPA